MRSLMFLGGGLARSHSGQVQKIRHIAEDIGRSVASPQELREM